MFDRKINFALPKWPNDDHLEMVYWLPNIEMVHEYYYCRVHPEQCGYKTFDRRDLEIHEGTCRVVSIDEGKQFWYHPVDSDVNELISDGLLSEEVRDYSQDEIVTFDIESYLANMNQGNQVVPLSIAVSSTIDTDKYFERASSDVSAGENMVFEFLDYLESLYAKFKERRVWFFYDMVPWYFDEMGPWSVDNWH